MIASPLRHYDSSYWMGLCSDIPKEAEYLHVKMGTFNHYFKPFPKHPSASYCDLLTGFILSSSNIGNNDFYAYNDTTNFILTLS